ncbi:MAG: hypothetical protein DRH24_03045 [Deltaproteobacteria bacterium]|nr:MAG: hypothetical protein DRH24_03045 [Deltaproteobacteria bacterium]
MRKRSVQIEEKTSQFMFKFIAFLASLILPVKRQVWLIRLLQNFHFSPGVGTSVNRLERYVCITEENFG